MDTMERHTNSNRSYPVHLLTIFSKRDTVLAACRLLSEFRGGRLYEQEFFVADEIELRPERF